MVAREQFAWVWLLTMVATYGAYFIAVSLTGEATFWNRIVMFAATAIAQILIIAIASIVIALRHKDALSGDERDRAIEHRASSVAYQVLICGVILVGCLMPFSHAGWDIFNAAVFAIILAEIVRHALIVSAYRRGMRAPKAQRGWHG